MGAPAANENTPKRWVLRQKRRVGARAWTSEHQQRAAVFHAGLILLSRSAVLAHEHEKVSSPDHEKQRKTHARAINDGGR